MLPYQASAGTERGVRVRVVDYPSCVKAELALGDPRQLGTLASFPLLDDKVVREERVVASKIQVKIISESGKQQK